MPVKNWNPDAIVTAALDKEEAQMGKAVQVFRNNVLRLLRVRNPDGKSPSAPGEPPRKVSGELFDSIFGKVVREQNQVYGLVGTNVKQGRRLELGFVGKDAAGRVYDQKPRPYLRPGYANSVERIRKILGGGGAG